MLIHSITSKPYLSFSISSIETMLNNCNNSQTIVIYIVVSWDGQGRLFDYSINMISIENEFWRALSNFGEWVNMSILSRG